MAVREGNLIRALWMVMMMMMIIIRPVSYAIERNKKIMKTIQLILSVVK